MFSKSVSCVSLTRCSDLVGDPACALKKKEKSCIQVTPLKLKVLLIVKMILF